MTTQNKEVIGEIIPYIDVYNEILGRVDGVPEAIAILEQIFKDRRSREIQASKQKVNWSKGNGATTKQKAFLASLGVEFPADISRFEATELIDNTLTNMQKVEA